MMPHINIQSMNVLMLREIEIWIGTITHQWDFCYYIMLGEMITALCDILCRSFLAVLSDERKRWWGWETIKFRKILMMDIKFIWRWVEAIGIKSSQPFLMDGCRGVRNDRFDLQEDSIDVFFGSDGYDAIIYRWVGWDARWLQVNGSHWFTWT